ncbi:hypothetical protein SAMN05444678_104245 [Sphingomonas sp. YR710]|uniref:hypothetical protein n=1 Tax=Sphingomonas sp. YR710 TaxID=1882773 RepID=UPI000889E163|nr:hypothetical protein [Sphingomonas sp. YR710]SDC66458.1 hypothetical protein SAMN05444678_104245 [Sphingomonas sp. YR710]
MRQAEARTLREEAVAHAHLAERAADLSWKHIFSEFTQDPVQIAATLATDAPIAWTLARESDADGGAYRFLAGVTVDEVRIGLSQGVPLLRVAATGEMRKGENVVMLPVGTDGILGELQVGTVGRLADGRAPAADDRRYGYEPAPAPIPSMSADHRHLQ